MEVKTMCLATVYKKQEEPDSILFYSMSARFL